MNIIDSYFQKHNLRCEEVCGVCTDGAPAMMGVQSRFQALVKQKNLNANLGTAFIIHRHALASRTLPPSLKTVLDSIVKAVNYIKGSALNTRLLRQLCQEMDLSHENLLFYTLVRWLSKGNVVSRMFSLREEKTMFLGAHNKDDLCVGWADEQKFAYLVDMFTELNKVNLQLQGKGRLVMDMTETIQAFVKKLENWYQKISNGNITMLPHLCSVTGTVGAKLQTLILEHIQAMQNQFCHYFRDLDSSSIARMIRNSFTADMTPNLSSWLYRPMVAPK